MGEYLLFQFLRVVAAILPMRLCYLIGSVWGEILHLCQGWKRVAVRANVAQILNCSPDSKEAKAMTRRIFRNFGHYLAEFLSPHWRIKRWFRDIPSEGMDILDTAYRQKRGVVLVTAHLGNWEVGGMAIATVGLLGCGQSSEPAATSVAAKATDGLESGEAHEHGVWWCDEHGVPEEICAQCSTKLAADFKAKGDWCEKHDRPESQCFICHPEKEAEFAALYEAKYGKKPPKPSAEGDEHGDHEHEEKS